MHQYTGCSRLTSRQERRKPRAAAARGVVARGHRRVVAIWHNRPFLVGRHAAVNEIMLETGDRQAGRRSRPRRIYRTPDSGPPTLDVLSPMLPPETRLEVVSQLPKRASRKPPLLFVHGGYCDAWCWTPYFLPWFAERGWPAYALSLRGHGASGGLGSLFVAGLDDFVADVEHVAGQLDAPPILIGHSMGAAVIERMLATRPVRAAALLAPVPPAGLLSVAARLAAAHPELCFAARPVRSVAAHRRPAGHAAAILFQRRRPDEPSSPRRSGT